MKRILRWIGLAVAGLVALVVLGSVVLYVMIELSRLPHDHRTVWLDGPGDARIRGVSWVQGGDMFDDPSERHEYTLVESDGTETRIGEGSSALDEAGARVYEHADQAELVVEDVVFRRVRSGRWKRFRAVDSDFIHRHYTPLANMAVHHYENSWRHTFTGVSCRIVSLDQAERRMKSACRDGRKVVTLVFGRAYYEAPWIVDAAATFAESPPPSRAPFPDTAHGTLSVLRAVPPKKPSTLPAKSRRFEVMLAEEGVELVRQIELEIARDERVEVPLEIGRLERNWMIQGGWIDSNGWPVLLWYRDQLRALPWDEAALVSESTVPRDGASYLIYVELRAE